MPQGVSQRASANSLRSNPRQHRRHLSLRNLPNAAVGAAGSDPTSSASPFANRLTPTLQDHGLGGSGSVRSTSPTPSASASAFSFSSTKDRLASSSNRMSTAVAHGMFHDTGRSGQDQHQDQHQAKRAAHPSHSRRPQEATSEQIDRLLESEPEEGIDLITAVETQDVFHLIHQIRTDLRTTIDTHLSWEELTSVDLNFSLVRPLAIKYHDLGSIAILYCLMLNRIYFQREANRDLAFQSVNNTRAALCELLAMKLLRTFSNDGLQLVTSLTASFHPLAGANDKELQELDLSTSHIDLQQVKKEGLPPKQFSNTLELAIQSAAKKFISSPLCQRCIDGIWHGKVVLSPIQASHAIVNDSYKKRPLSIYDPVKAPFLNHLRLRVPAIRSKLEFVNFVIILLLYVAALAQKGSPTWTVQETLFSIWLFGFAVDELAQLQEHGFTQYMGSLYNLLDMLFCIISFFWFGLRVTSFQHGGLLVGRSDLSFDCLALGAVLLCPRVASSLVQDNVVLLSLKAMLADFAFFTVLAMICFSGFAYSFYSLATEERWSFKAVLWLMLKVWFGSSYLGFDEAKSFSAEFGPPLMILYTILSNTLLLTVLISLLSNTFQIVAMNANEEAMFQFACKTMNGITTDAIFSYQPPLNLLAVLIVMPLSFVVSPRWLHKINVLLIRATSFPILLLIRFYELHYATPGSTNSAVGGISLHNNTTTASATATGTEKGRNFLSKLAFFNSGFDRGSTDIIEVAFDYSPQLDSADDTDDAEDDCVPNRAHDPADQSKQVDLDKGSVDPVSGGARQADESMTDAASTPVKQPQPQTSANQDASRSDGDAVETVDRSFDSGFTSRRSRSSVLRQQDQPSSTIRSTRSQQLRPRRRNQQSLSSMVQQQEPRGLGTLSSPLAKLFGRVLEPEYDREREPSEGAGSSRGRTYPRSSLGRGGHQSQGSQGEQHVNTSTSTEDSLFFTGASNPTPTAPSNKEKLSSTNKGDSPELDAELRTIASKIQEIDARGKHIQDLLLKLLEGRS